VTDNEDGTFTVDYCAPAPGNYTLNVVYGGVAVPCCPLKVPIQPHVDVSKIKVDGLEPSKFLVNNNIEDDDDDDITTRTTLVIITTLNKQTNQQQHTDLISGSTH
jgi:hypothetical protein